MGKLEGLSFKQEILNARMTTKKNRRDLGLEFMIDGFAFQPGPGNAGEGVAEKALNRKHQIPV